MEYFKVPQDEYKELLTIKKNASLLALSMNEDYRLIVEKLCEEHTEKTSRRLDKYLEDLENKNKLKKIDE